MIITEHNSGIFSELSIINLVLMFKSQTSTAEVLFSLMCIILHFIYIQFHLTFYHPVTQYHEIFHLTFTFRSSSLLSWITWSHKQTLTSHLFISWPFLLIPDCLFIPSINTQWPNFFKNTGKGPCQTLLKVQIDSISAGLSYPLAQLLLQRTAIDLWGLTFLQNYADFFPKYHIHLCVY